MDINKLLLCFFSNGNIRNGITLLSVALSFCSPVIGQISVNQLNGGAGGTVMPTSVPFLTIAPDGRSAGMGDAGAASSPDVNSQHWNSAKYAFIDGEGGISLTYTPWLRSVVPNINLGYISGYYKINPKSAVSGSFRNFSLGKQQQMGLGIMMPPYYQYEFAFDAGYCRVITDHFSGGIVLRYIHSDLLNRWATPSGEEPPSGKSIAGDISLYYQRDTKLGSGAAQWALGINISNIGPPVSYQEDGPDAPIPTNLRLGGRFTFDVNTLNTISLHTDINKLMVPTSGVYREDMLSGNLLLERGKEVPETVLKGMFQSFYDAPGVLQSDGSYSVLAEELNEISFAFGAEYWYKKQLAFRTGYFNEHSTKGNRKYFTLGIGVRYAFLTCDISYLLPQYGRNSPMFNTFRLSLTAEIGKT